MRDKFIGTEATISIGVALVQPGDTVGHDATHPMPDREVVALRQRYAGLFEPEDPNPAPVEEPPPPDEGE